MMMQHLFRKLNAAEILNALLKCPAVHSEEVLTLPEFLVGKQPLRDALLCHHRADNPASAITDIVTFPLDLADNGENALILQRAALLLAGKRNPLQVQQQRIVCRIKEVVHALLPDRRERLRYA
jgi:hypothetical protein